MLGEFRKHIIFIIDSEMASLWCYICICIVYVKRSSVSLNLERETLYSPQTSLQHWCFALTVALSTWMLHRHLQLPSCGHIISHCTLSLVGVNGWMTIKILIPYMTHSISVVGSSENMDWCRYRKSNLANYTIHPQIPVNAK